jgi:hypothetical protein
MFIDLIEFKAKLKRIKRLSGDSGRQARRAVYAGIDDFQGGEIPAGGLAERACREDG